MKCGAEPPLPQGVPKVPYPFGAGQGPALSRSSIRRPPLHVRLLGSGARPARANRMQVDLGDAFAIEVEEQETRQGGRRSLVGGCRNLPTDSPRLRPLSEPMRWSPERSRLDSEVGASALAEGSIQFPLTPASHPAQSSTGSKHPGALSTASWSADTSSPRLKV